MASSPNAPVEIKSRTVMKSLSNFVGFCYDKYLFSQFIDVVVLPSFRFIKQKNKLVFLLSFFNALFNSFSVFSLSSSIHEANAANALDSQ